MVGMPKQDKVSIVPIGPGEAHIQNEIANFKCYICGKNEDDDMVLIRIKEKEMGFACIDHPGVVQEFIRQFQRPPLGWELTKNGD
jgi:hypothetical protein